MIIDFPFVLTLSKHKNYFLPPFLAFLTYG